MIRALAMAWLLASAFPAWAAVIETRYEGDLDYEAHFRRPGETRPYRSIMRFYTDGAHAYRMEWNTWEPADSSPGDPESFLVVGSSVFHRDAPGKRWRSLSGERAELARMQAEAPFPVALARDLKGRAIEDRDAMDRVRVIDAVRAHPRLGDVHNDVRYTYDSFATDPNGFEMRHYDRDANWSMRARRVPVENPAAAESLLAAPLDFDPPEPDSVQAPALRPVADGVWSVDMPDIDSRSLVVEFKREVAVIEAAVGSANGERIVDLVERQWPKKPIRHFFFSHYHPHYAGGMRAFMAEWATIVTTPGNEAFVRQVARYPFHMAPDRFAKRKSQKVEVEVFKDHRYELSDGTNRLVAVDIGTRSDHTDEFAVFWLPKQGILFESEQGWVTGTDGKLRASRRAATLLEVLHAQGIEPTKFVQSWPMAGEPAEVTRAELDALIQARKK